MPIKNSNHKRKHHRLPEHYLRGFCERSFLWIYELTNSYNPGIKKHKNNPYRSGVVEIAERDLYKVVMPNGKPDFETFENHNEKIEKPMSKIFRKVCSQTPISYDEKNSMAKYIQNIIKRTIEREQRFRQLIDKNLKNPLWKNIALSLALQGEFEAAKRNYDELKYAESGEGKKYFLLESMVTSYAELHKNLMAMRWTFNVAAKDSYFVTSSTPVSFSGIGQPISSFLFPISKDITLMATHDERTDLEFKNMSSDETLIINFFTIRNARNVYAPKAEEWIWGILNQGLEMTENQSLALRNLFPFPNR